MRPGKGPLIAVVVALVTLCIGEVVLRLVAPLPDPYEHLKWRREDMSPQYIVSQFDPNLHVTVKPEAGLPGVAGRNSFTTNNAGFRGDPLRLPKPADEYRIFMVGGSTTECLMLDDKDAVTAVLQRELQARFPSGPTFKVYNAGKSGDRTDDHIAMLVHRILLMEPDLIIVFPGINDLRAAIYGFDYLHYQYQLGDVEHEAHFSERASSYRLGFWSLLRLAAYESQIGRRLYYLSRPSADGLPGGASEPARLTLEETLRNAARLGQPVRDGIRLRVALNRTAERTDAAPRTDLGSYRANLRTIAAVVPAHGARLVLVSQQTTWDSAVDPEVERWHWMTTVSHKTYRTALMAAALEAYNDALREIAREQSVPLCDLARELPKTLELFYDDVHFNVAGARRAGASLAAVIAALPFPPARNHQPGH
jgi:lysophospholipase L1-like esterase